VLRAHGAAGRPRFGCPAAARGGRMWGVRRGEGSLLGARELRWEGLRLCTRCRQRSAPLLRGGACWEPKFDVASECRNGLPV
jgi:hypothetical protein